MTKKQRRLDEFQFGDLRFPARTGKEIRTSIKRIAGRCSHRVAGDLHEARISVLDEAGVWPRHLNKHIPYGVSPVPAGVKERSLATPVGLAVTADGSTLYVTAFGSAKIGVFETGELDAPRAQHAAAVSKDSKYMFIYGGYDGTKPLSDFWLLDLGTMALRQIEIETPMPEARSRHSGAPSATPRTRTSIRWSPRCPARSSRCR